MENNHKKKQRVFRNRKLVYLNAVILIVFLSSMWLLNIIFFREACVDEAVKSKIVDVCIVNCSGCLAFWNLELAICYKQPIAKHFKKWIGGKQNDENISNQSVPDD